MSVLKQDWVHLRVVTDRHDDQPISGVHHRNHPDKWHNEWRLHYVKVAVQTQHIVAIEETRFNGVGNNGAGEWNGTIFWLADGTSYLTHHELSSFEIVGEAPR